MSLDTEDNSKGKVYLINFYDGAEHFTFRTRVEAIEWLSNQPGHIEIWCTNLGYDLNNLFGDQITCTEIIYAGSRVISARFLGTSIRFRDTLNHWKISVREMGIRIGLEKLDAGGDFNNVKYCRRDSEITFLFVEHMADKYQSIGAKLKTTIGSTALDFFYGHYHGRPHNRDIPKETEMQFILKGYYGGRTEIFFNKPVEGNIHYVDVNSLYPAVMRENVFPILSSRKKTKRPDFTKEGMANVTFKAPNLEIPYLPYRDPKTYRLVFPTGRFTGTYTYFEIREAQRLGYDLVRINDALEYRGGTYRPFEKFVDTLYESRMQAKRQDDELLTESYKLLMNNLYGKFGQGNEITKLVPIDRAKLKSGDVVFNGMMLVKEKKEYPRHSNGIWAAYVTAYARAKLYEGLCKVRDSGGLLIYCDTDSIIFEHSSGIFPDSKALGEFKIEGQFKYAHFKLPKLYCLVDAKTEVRKYRAKGVPRAEAESFFETGKAKFKRPYKLREVLRRNLSPKRTEKLIPNYWETVEKTIYQKYDKRIVLNSGHTKPLEVMV